MSELIQHEMSVMDEIEKDANDPRVAFHHNYLTTDDRRRAEARRQLEFPGLYPNFDEELEAQAGPSGINKITKSGVSKFTDRQSDRKEKNGESSSSMASGLPQKKSQINSSESKKIKQTRLTDHGQVAIPADEQTNNVVPDVESADIEAEPNQNNCNNSQSLTSSPDGFVYDHDYRQYDGQYRSERPSNTELDTVETAVSTTTITKRRKVRASSPFDAEKMDKIQRTKDWLKRGRKKPKRKATVDELLMSSFRSDNAKCPGNFG